MKSHDQGSHCTPRLAILRENAAAALFSLYVYWCRNSVTVLLLTLLGDVSPRRTPVMYFIIRFSSSVPVCSTASSTSRSTLMQAIISSLLIVFKWVCDSLRGSLNDVDIVLCRGV